MLATLIVVVIIAALYVILMKAILPFGGMGGGGGTPIKQVRPWLLEDLITPADKLIDMPKPPKVAIDEVFEVKAAVSRNGSDRNFATLKFDISGDVSGKWQCDYTTDGREYSYMAVYAGNIVADREFSDENGDDESLLFFIVKGTYTQRVFHPDLGEKLTEGIIYLTGWIGPDKGLKGILTITDDVTAKDMWAASYELAAPAK